MIHRMADRCKKICGVPGKDCYINSKEQLKCLTDVVINKTSGISMLLGFSLGETDKAALDENLRETLAITNELSNWIKYLQMIGDLKELSSLVLDADSAEKRREVRYPLPDSLMKYIYAEIKAGSSPLKADIVNFSQSGIQLKSPEPISPDVVSDCKLLLVHPEHGEVPFRAKVKYCANAEGVYILGAHIEDVSSGGDFNFFNNVHRFITETGI